jgi:hypothetical protein
MPLPSWPAMSTAVAVGVGDMARAGAVCVVCAGSQHANDDALCWWWLDA